ncbi:MAG: hypothetical protein ACLFTR_02910 [Candidatus Woesearchaeota archaeon]
MKELALIPIVFSLIVGMSIELIDIAEDSSEKALRYTEAMEKGIDCAFRGELILECSPELASIKFDEDVNRFDKTLDDIREELKNVSDELNISTDELFKEFEKHNASEHISKEELDELYRLIDESA